MHQWFSYKLIESQGNANVSDQKRFYNRETIRSIRISRLAKIPTLYRGRDPWIKNRVNYWCCIEGKGRLKDIHCSAQNAAVFVDLLWNIFCLFKVKCRPEYWNNDDANIWEAKLWIKCCINFKNLAAKLAQNLLQFCPK